MSDWGNYSKNYNNFNNQNSVLQSKYDRAKLRQARLNNIQQGMQNFAADPVYTALDKLATAYVDRYNQRGIDKYTSVAEDAIKNYGNPVQGSQQAPVEVPQQPTPQQQAVNQEVQNTQGMFANAVGMNKQAEPPKDANGNYDVAAGYKQGNPNSVVNGGISLTPRQELRNQIAQEYAASFNGSDNPTSDRIAANQIQQTAEKVLSGADMQSFDGAGARRAAEQALIDKGVPAYQREEILRKLDGTINQRKEQWMFGKATENYQKGVDALKNNDRDKAALYFAQAGSQNKVLGTAGTNILGNYDKQAARNADFQTWIDKQQWNLDHGVGGVGRAARGTRSSNGGYSNVGSNGGNGGYDSNGYNSSNGTYRPLYAKSGRPLTAGETADYKALINLQQAGKLSANQQAVLDGYNQRLRSGNIDLNNDIEGFVEMADDIWNDNNLTYPQKLEKFQKEGLAKSRFFGSYANQRGLNYVPGMATLTGEPGSESANYVGYDYEATNDNSKEVSSGGSNYNSDYHDSTKPVETEAATTSFPEEKKSYEGKSVTQMRVGEIFDWIVDSARNEAKRETENQNNRYKRKG